MEQIAVILQNRLYRVLVNPLIGIDGNSIVQRYIPASNDSQGAWKAVSVPALSNIVIEMAKAKGLSNVA